MAKLKYLDYYRQFGVRRYQELLSPRLRLVQLLQLPRYAVYHYTATDPSLIGPPENEYMLSKESAQLWISFADDLATKQGAPRRDQRFQLPRAKLDYRASHRRFRLVTDLSTVEKNINAQIVANYAHLNHMYIYRPTLTRWYDEWFNVRKTIWSKANEIAQQSDRQHFLLFRIPSTLPKISLMRTTQQAPTRNNLMNFATPEELSFFDFFRWLGTDRENSTMASLDRATLDKLNVVFTDGVYFFTLNLGLLEEWRTGLVKEGEELDKTTLETFQRRWMMAVTRLWSQSANEEEQKQEEEQVLRQERDILADSPDAEYDDRDVVLPNGEDLTTVLDPDELEAELVGGSDEDDDADAWNAIVERSFEDVREVPGVEVQPDFQPDEDQDITDDLFEVVTDDTEEEKVDVFDAATLPKTHGEYIQSLSDAVLVRASDLADAGQLSGVQYKAAMRNADAIHEIEAPDGSGLTLAEYVEVKPKAAKLAPAKVMPEADVIVDKSLCKSTLAVWDKHYVEHVMQKDIAAAVVAVQQAGYPVTGYKVEDVVDVMGDYQVITIKLAPVGGVPTTFPVMLPKVRKDGIYVVNGIKYRMRKQRVDKPIRKVSSSEVALSTAYGKVFVKRSERVVNNAGRWLTRQLTAMYYDKSSPLTTLKRGNVFDPAVKVPYYFAVLARNYTQIQFADWDIRLDIKTLPEFIGEDRFNEQLAEGLLTFARNTLGEFLAIDKRNQLYICQSGQTPTPVGTFPDFFGINAAKMPIEAADLEFMGVRIPVGVVLSYLGGLTPLLEHLKANYRTVPRGSRMGLAPDEFAVSFDDESLIFSKDDRMTTLLLGGFNEYRNYIGYARGAFDNRDIYFNVVDGAGLKVRHLRELELMERLFVDPVSRTLLQNMGEPTDFAMLLLRAVELLLDDWAPNTNDVNYQRFKTYDKFAELVYKDLVGAIRQNENSSQGNRQKISISPVSVWNQILDDSASIVIDETNPMLDIKQGEEATMTGIGGRSKTSLRRARDREYDKSDVGIVSEGTKDSGDVGISAYLAPNANIVSVYGETRPFDEKTDGISSVMSTSALAVPAVDRDDGKRLVFVGIQHNRMIAAEGYDVQPWRTGGETVIAHRVGKLFAAAAQGDGVVKKVTKTALTIQYDDPELGEEVFQLGTIIGKGPGKYYPHDLITDYKVGDRVKDQDVVVFHRLYFKRDWWNPGQVVWRAGVLSLVGILDIPETHEDSSYIFDNLADRLVTPSIKSRTLIVDAHLNIRGLVKIGDHVEPRTILATLEEPIATDLSDESQEAVEALRRMSQYNPRADVHGEVVQIDVLYRAQIEDMSETMAALVGEADKARAKRVKELKLNEATTGRINNSNVRIDGNPLGENQIAIRIFMRYDLGAGMGDKGTFAAQAKSVVSSVGHGVNKTEDGHTLDAIFSGTSIANRIIGSPEVVGTVNLGLLYATERAVDIYFNEAK